MTTANCKEKRLWVRSIEKYYELKEKLDVPHLVNRKKYLWLCALATVGANQFYAGHYLKGLFYLALSWTGIPAALGFIDWMAAIPKEADEKGNILI